jgi:hypothetical protein
MLTGKGAASRMRIKLSPSQSRGAADKLEAVITFLFDHMNLQKTDVPSMSRFKLNPVWHQGVLPSSADRV